MPLGMVACVFAFQNISKAIIWYLLLVIFIGKFPEFNFHVYVYVTFQSIGVMVALFKK